MVRGKTATPSRRDVHEDARLHERAVHQGEVVDVVRRDGTEQIAVVIVERAEHDTAPGQRLVQLDVGHPAVAQHDEAGPFTGHCQHALERLGHGRVDGDVGAGWCVRVDVELTDAAVAPDLLGVGGQRGAGDALRRHGAPRAQPSGTGHAGRGFRSERGRRHGNRSA